MDRVKHFSHNHNLEIFSPREVFGVFPEFRSTKRSEYFKFRNKRCGLCNRVDCPDGDICFVCFRCSYLIHKGCAKMPKRKYFHQLHDRDHYLFLNKRSLPATTCCYYCKESFENDECYTYGCDECSDFYMHMACAAISVKMKMESSTSDCVGGDGIARFDCHLHSMRLVESDESDEGQVGNCFACQSPWLSGPVYCCASKSEGCKIFLHKSCAELPKRIQHSLDPYHSLELQVSTPRSCNICDRIGCRLIYCCNECRIDLCVKCPFLTPVKCLSHDHPLGFTEKSSWDIHCDGCQRSYKDWVDFSSTAEVKSTQCYVFSCFICDFNLHFLCGPLPTSVKYGFHIHPLTLVDHSKTKDDSDEYYCDVCEQERDPFFRVYYCKECKYVAHIHCVISEILKKIKEFTKDVEFRALGESRWEFGIESEKEKQDDATEHLKMSDIVDRLTRLERSSLVYHFGCEDPKYNSRRVASHNRYSKLNSCFDHKGISIDDIDTIRQFFSFGPDEFANFRRKLHWFTPFEGLKIDDKYLRQKVEDVDGYMVPKTLVPILKTLLHKHKDLGGKSNLTPNMKSMTSTLLCIVIDKMCKTMVEDITEEDLKSWYFYLDAIKKISGFEIIELDFFDNFLLPTFLGFEVTRQEKEIGEILDQKIETLRRYEENREKFKSYASEKSDFLKECSSNASKWKGKFLGDTWF